MFESFVSSAKLKHAFAPVYEFPGKSLPEFIEASAWVSNDNYDSALFCRRRRVNPRISRIEPFHGLTCVAKGLGSFLGMMSFARLPGKPRLRRSFALPAPGRSDRFLVTSQVEATREAPVRAESHPTRGFLGLFKDRARGGAGIGHQLILVIGTRNVLCGARQQLG
jgi:hypothetical protein